jgi:O-antigen/teichoic acid export membrane protein
MAGEDLRNKAKRGFVWNTVERLVTNGIQFILTVILARLLSPDDYGIIAMPAIFLAIAQVFIDSGFANALIRKPDLNEKDLSTAFYFNVIVGVVAYFLLFVTSPLIADFFNTPILSRLLKVTALVVFLNSLGIVQQAVLTKKMDFKSQAVISAISTFVSGALGVWMAYSGYGVWALVFQQVSAALLRVVMLWGYGRWKPLWIWSKESFAYLWNFGSKVIIIGLLDTIFNNVYAFVIGKKYNAKDLGNYTRAQQFADLPINNINSIVQKVTLPLLSEIQDDDSRLSSIYLRLIEMSSLLVIPLMFGLAAMANPLIISLLGKEWEGCVLLFQILCIARFWTPFNAINVNLLQVKGRTDLLLRLEIAKKIVITIILGLTFYRGVVFLVGGFAVCTFIAFMINTFYTKRLIGVSLWKQLQAILPAIVISIVMMVAILFVNMMFTNIYTMLVVDILLCVIIYSMLVFCFKREALKELISLVIKR